MILKIKKNLNIASMNIPRLGHGFTFFMESI